MGLPYTQGYDRKPVQPQYRTPTALGMYSAGLPGKVEGLREGDRYISLADQGITPESVQAAMRHGAASDQGSLFGTQRSLPYQGSLRSSMPSLSGFDLYATDRPVSDTRASMEGSIDIRSSHDLQTLDQVILSRSITGQPITPRDPRAGTVGLSAALEEPNLTEALRRQIAKHTTDVHTISGYGSQSLQAALHSSARPRSSSSAYSYDREGENLRHASTMLINLRGDLETSAMRRQKLDTSLALVKRQIMQCDAACRDNKAEVNQREDAIKQARIDLRSEVEKSLMESASRFKQGRESTETALKAYHAACGKMSEGLKVMKGVSDELAAGVLPPAIQSSTPTTFQLPPRYHVGTVLQSQDIFNVVSSPMGTHYRSPMGTTRPIGIVRGTLA